MPLLILIYKMVYLRKKAIKGKEYFYLVHSIRENNNHKKIERYIGPKEPNKTELSKLKTQFLSDIKKSSWLCLTEKEFSIIEKIRATETEMIDDEKLMDFCINFIYNTNAIEGNALSHEETKNLLKHDLATKKSFKDEMESFSHKKVFMEMISSRKPLTLHLLKRWHKDLFLHSKPSIAGRFRKNNVRIAGFKAPHYLDVDILMHQFIAWYNESKKTMHPIELASMTHLKFVKIHPFMDGNGRIARMLLNYVLHKNNYPMTNIKYSKREEYYTTLDRYDATQEESVFIRYIISNYIKEHSAVSQT